MGAAYCIVRNVVGGEGSVEEVEGRQEEGDFDDAP